MAGSTEEGYHMQVISACGVMGSWCAVCLYNWGGRHPSAWHAAVTTEGILLHKRHSSARIWSFPAGTGLKTQILKTNVAKSVQSNC